MAVARAQKQQEFLDNAVRLLDITLTNGIVALRYFNLMSVADECEPKLVKCRQVLTGDEVPSQKILKDLFKLIDETTSYMLYMWVVEGLLNVERVTFQPDYEKLMTSESDARTRMMSKLIENSEKRRAWMNISDGDVNKGVGKKTS